MLRPLRVLGELPWMLFWMSWDGVACAGYSLATRQLPTKSPVPEAVPSPAAVSVPWPMGLPLDVLAEEAPHQVGDLVAVLLEREVGGVE